MGDAKINSIRTIPEPTLRRLVLYYKFIKENKDKCKYISATIIAEAMNLLPIVVRKDLASTGCVGQPRLGFNSDELLNSIKDALGWNNTTDAFLVGVGSLGRALLSYKGFENLGVNIVAGFDIDPYVIASEINGKEILPLEKMPNLLKRMHINIGIITVPPESAQEVADLLVANGIKAIWNFAPVEVKVPEHIIMQHENLAASLSYLSSRLRKMNGLSMAR